MHGASFRIGQTNVNEYNENTIALAKLLNREGSEDEESGRYPRMEQTETPFMDEMKSQIRKVAPSYNETDSIIPTQVVSMTEQMVAKKFSTLVVESSIAIWQCSYEEARMGALLVFRNVVEKIQLDLLRREVRDEILNKPIASYFDTSDAADQVDEKLLSTNSSVSRITAFTTRKAGKAVAA